MGKPFKTMIDRARMITCKACAKLGSAYREPLPARSLRSPAASIRSAQVLPKKTPAPALTVTLEVAEDSGRRVRSAREKAGLSHEDLGRKIREKVSVLRKIESGKMIPDHVLAGKLARALKIELLVPPSEPKIPSSASPSPREVTMGEFMRLKKKAEGTGERKPSSSSGD